MLDQVNRKHKFVVSIQDIIVGKTLERGKKEPLATFQAK